MFALLRGANGRRHEVDLQDDPVTVDVAMRATDRPDNDDRRRLQRSL